MSDFQRFLDEKLSSIDFQESPSVRNPVNEYDIYAEIRESISALRKQRKLTQKELAEKTGLTQANICNLERGTTKPTIETLKKIADATGTRLVISFDE
jgi:ribosome-binding protein aMBF1 (putative translation factor)